jgi:choline kinase
MAGAHARAKPLLELDGLLLIERTILALACAGVHHFRVVVGTNAEEIGEALRARARLAKIDIQLVHCANARFGNGHSLAAGVTGLEEPFILCMSDHVFDPAIAWRLQARAAADPGRVHLATDANIGGVFDLDDATKVRVDGDVIRELGKGLASYSRIDVGLFHCPAWMSETAAQAVAAGAHSVSDVMRRAIDEDALRSCPIEPLFWQDVDTPAMLGEAQRRLRAAGDVLQARTSRRPLRALGLMVALALLAWVIARQPFSEIAAVVAPLPWTVLGLLGFPLLWFASNSLGLWLVVRGRVGLRSLFFNRVAGEGLNALLPMAGLGGEPFKVRHLGRWLPPQEAATSVIASRVIEELGGVVFAGACLVISGRALLWPEWLRAGTTVLGLVLVAAGLAATLLLSGRVPARFAALVMRLVRRRGACPQGTPAALGPWRVLGALGLHLVGRLAGFLEVVFLLHILGIDASPAAAAGVTALLLLAGVATLVFPQGIGALEAASVFALGLLGQPAALGVAFGLLRRSRMLIYGALGSALGLLAFRAARPASRGS